MPLRRSILLVMLHGLNACTQEEGLPPFPNPDRITVGQLKSVVAAGSVTHPGTIETITEFANNQRLNNSWSDFQYVHGPCTIALQLLAGNTSLGYFAMSNRQLFVTNGRMGPVSRTPTAQQLAAFIEAIPKEALPPPFLSGQCPLP